MRTPTTQINKVLADELIYWSRVELYSEVGLWPGACRVTGHDLVDGYGVQYKPDGLAMLLKTTLNTFKSLQTLKTLTSLEIFKVLKTKQ